MGSQDYSGRTIDKYRLLERIGRGGMGSVYRGEHTIVGRKVAVKFLHAEFVGNAEIVKRFYREAQSAAAIGHRNIIDVLDVGVSPEGEPYLVMEYLEGESLAGLSRRRWPLDLAAACGIAEPVLRALGAAHAKGIVHRDLKPDNIFIAHVEGEAPIVKLIDFGISKITRGDGSSKLTQTGTCLGTPSYMSPEQARGASDVDHRTDLFAMGVILYEMLAGDLPFVGENYNALLIRIITEDPRLPKDVNPDFPDEAVPLVQRALEKNPAQRFQSAAEMLKAIGDMSAFGHRTEHLTSIASTLHNKDVAGGDLGDLETPGGSGNLAADLLNEISSHATPDRWSDTGAKGAARKRRTVIGAAAASAAVMIGALAAIALWFQKPPPAKAKAEPAPAATVSRSAAAADEGVLVTVKDAPPGATIIFEGAPVPMNPFRAKRTKTVSPLRVEANGFEPFAISIVPEKDVFVVVTMKALLKPEKQETAKVSTAGARQGEGHGKRRAGGGKPLTGTGAKAEKKLSQGRRGALISEDFE
jgi:eukaryotic-like serine/threonine-protein kinase